MQYLDHDTMNTKQEIIILFYFGAKRVLQRNEEN